MATTAFLLVTLAAVIHALWNFAAKKASGDFAVIWIGLVMASVAFAPLVLVLTPEQRALREVAWLLLLSGLVHSAYFLLLARSYRDGEISVVYPIARGSGVAGTAIVALLFLDETLSLAGGLGIALIVLGVVFIGLRDAGQPRAMGLALLVGLSITSYSILAKLAVGICHPFFYLWGFLITTTLLLAPFVCLVHRSALRRAWEHKKTYSLLIGPGSMANYLIVLFAMQMAQVSYVVAARELAVVIGAGLGIFLLREPSTPRKIGGIASVVAGILLLKMA